MTRRDAILIAAATPLAMAEQAPQQGRSANDKVQIALIGAGGQGMSRYSRVASDRARNWSLSPTFTRAADPLQGKLGQGYFHYARLSRSPGSPRCRCGHHRHAGSLASEDQRGRVGGRQERVLRKADGTTPERRARRDRGGAEGGADFSGRQPARELDCVPKSERSSGRKARSAN